MKKLLFACPLFVTFSFVHFFSNAQAVSPSTPTIAVFAPLYLDSAFDDTHEYRYGKNFPKFLNPGLEFYEGVNLAVDSLTRVGARLNIRVYDTRSATTSVAQHCALPEFSEVDLIIGHVNSSELVLLANVAKKKNIPFVNVNLPNDGGIANNPSLVILNSTLKTHCRAIYKFLQKNYATSPIIVFRRKGSQEDILRQYFTEIEQSTASVPLRLRYITLPNNFSATSIRPYLDSTQVTMCIAGSLDLDFAKNLSVQLAHLNELYPSQVIGMPTWDGIRDFNKPEYKGLEVFYSTPFYNGKADRVSVAITNYFKDNLYSRPSDMVFRGYECILRFGKLLIDHGPNLVSSIGQKKYKVFTDFDIQPVFLNNKTPTFDYLENKKLYFVKMVDGVIRAVY